MNIANQARPSSGVRVDCLIPGEVFCHMSTFFMMTDSVGAGEYADMYEAVQLSNGTITTMQGTVEVDLLRDAIVLPYGGEYETNPNS